MQAGLSLDWRGQQSFDQSSGDALCGLPLSTDQLLQDVPQSVWRSFEPLQLRIRAYLVSSEREFSNLIEGLDDCWNMTESVQKATALLALASQNKTAEGVRLSMIEALNVFRNFLDHIEGSGRQLDLAIYKTRGLSRLSDQLQQDVVPLKYIAFNFLLEGARLSEEEGATVQKMYEEMQDVLKGIQRSGISQEKILAAVLEKLSAATQLVKQASRSYAVRATESEQRIQNNLDLLMEVPPDLLAVRNKAAAIAIVVERGIREAVKALQGHDHIRQRMEHILSALTAIRGAAEEGSASKLVLQREQARQLRGLIVGTATRIEEELSDVARSAHQIASEASTLGDGQSRRFEEAVDRLRVLGVEVGELLAGEARVGNFVMTHIEPVRGLLKANTGELEALARSMKRLAFNVRIESSNIAETRVIDTLGIWTSETSGRVLQRASELNAEFAVLVGRLDEQAQAIASHIENVESKHVTLVELPPDAALRTSRRASYVEVARLGLDATTLQQHIEALVLSIKFADEGSVLLGEMDTMLHSLLEQYPEDERLFHSDAALAGYTMREQHDVHAMAFGGEAQKAGYERLSELLPGDDLGDNIELF